MFNIVDLKTHNYLNRFTLKTFIKLVIQLTLYQNYQQLQSQPIACFIVLYSL